MKKIGIKFDTRLDYEHFEPLQYWLSHDFEYEDLEAYINEDKVIELELEDDDDREEDLEMLKAFLEKFDKDEIVYELFVMKEEWGISSIKDIIEY